MDAPQIGTVLHSRYILRQQLGQNTTRQTWLAEDTSSNSRVAIKMLAFNLQLQWQEVKLFEREAQALQKLDHPRIPRYLDYFTLDGTPDWFVLVQTYIPGESLQTLLTRGLTFDEERLRQIATDALNLLIYLHERYPPILHRDIKPSNLIAGKGRQTFLVDFGAAQIQPAQMGTFTVVGTYGYTPMEQFGGRAVPASDLFALGATLVHLATGIPPADLPQVDGKIDFHNRVRLSPGFTEWMDQLIEPSAGDRPIDARIAYKKLKSTKSSLERKTIPQSDLPALSKPYTLQQKPLQQKPPRKASSLIESGEREASYRSSPKRNSTVKPDGKWHKVAWGLAASRIKYRESEDRLEIVFKAHDKGESYKLGESLTTSSMNMLALLAFLLSGYFILSIIYAIFIGELLPFLALLNWFVPAFIFVLFLMYDAESSVAYECYGKEFIIRVSHLSLDVIERMNLASSKLISGRTYLLDSVKWYGTGDAFSDKSLSNISISIVNKDLSLNSVSLKASLRPSELEVLQEIINNKILAFQEAYEDT